MKQLFLFTVLLILILAPVSCEKSKYSETRDCTILKDGLLKMNTEAVGSEISKITDGLQPLPSTQSEPGHLRNLEIVIDQINYCNNLRAELSCYACIYTLPPQSEIVIMIDSSGRQVRRVLDIRTPVNDVLSFAGIHK